MAKRLKTRLSAGAALVTGLSAFGIGMMATPAQAATVTQNYECSFDVLNVGVTYADAPVQVDLTVNVPAESVESGTEIASDVSAKVTIQNEQRDALYGLLGVRAVDGPNAEDAAAEDGGLNTHGARNQANFTLSDGTSTEDGLIPLEVPLTAVPDSGELVVDATGAVAPVTVGEPGTYTFEAGDFQAYIRGYGDAEGSEYKTNITMNCTNVSDDKVVATVDVTEATDEPTDPDPSESTDDPADPDPSESTDDPTEPEPTNTDGDDAGDGDAGDGDAGDGDAGDGDAGDGDASDPETPGVVQTDDASALPGGGSAAFLLGGVLLAGAGAGAVTVARRRSGAQH